MENNIIAIIKEPFFWVLTAIGSVLLSIIANLLTPRIQNFIAKHSNKKKEKIEKEKIAIRDLVIRIHESGTYRISWQVEAVLLGVKGAGIILLFLAFSRVMAIFPFHEIRFFVYPILAGGSVYGFKKILNGINDAGLVKLADAREAALRSKSGEKGTELTTTERIETLDQWDLENLGVNSKNKAEQG